MVWIALGGHGSGEVLLLGARVILLAVILLAGVVLRGSTRVVRPLASASGVFLCRPSGVAGGSALAGTGVGGGSGRGTRAGIAGGGLPGTDAG